jgi:carbon-monoxide dehydrogenase iron sulfur subunit
MLSIMPMDTNPFIHIDPEKCSGCRLCEMACAMMHTGRCSPKHSRIHILRLGGGSSHVPLLCQACEQAPCIKCCPMNARGRTAEGAVVTDPDRCIGCRACLYICPFAAPVVSPGTGKTMTCDLCADDGTGPWCVKACRDCGALKVFEARQVVARKCRESAAIAKNALKKPTHRKTP